MSKVWRKLVLLGLDLVLSVAAAFLAFVVRFALDGRGIPSEYVWDYINVLPYVIPLRIVVYYLCGLYSQVWTHASVPELIRIVYAISIDSVITTSIIFATNTDGYPRSVVLISWFLKLAAMGSIRLALRIRRDLILARRGAQVDAQRTLIFGAGDAGAMLAREMAKHPELRCEVVGFIDDDPSKQGFRVAGKPVLGTRSALKRVVSDHAITNMIIAMPSARGSVVREIVEAGRGLGLQLKTLPGIFELVNGAVTVSQIRDVQIEDVLGRDEVQVDLAAIAAYLSDEVVLVTGAGGSIGSELCRQVARFGPRKLLLLGHGENSIYEIDLELRTSYPSLELRPIIADIQDEARIRRVFEQFRPGVVFHAAAHKHVPLMEYNPEEAIKNNVLGTLNVARAADFYRAKRFVLISSDKAVNPTSVMGATKRAAECVVQSMASTSQTIFVAVRFGNVLGSRGSVIPLFKRQIAAGGPVTITDKKMIRYFMTIPEATQLVVQAAGMGAGGEVFVLDMGKPVRIVDLATDLIRLSGLEPGVDIEIKETGIRPGEKLYEELLTGAEGMEATKHQRIFIARPDAVTAADMQSFVDQLKLVAGAGQASNQQIRSMVADLTEKVTLRGAVGN